jgi:transposase
MRKTTANAVRLKATWNIAATLTVSQSTVSACLKRAKQTGLSRPPPKGMDETALERLLFAATSNRTRH